MKTVYTKPSNHENFLTDPLETVVQCNNVYSRGDVCLIPDCLIPGRLIPGRLIPRHLIPGHLMFVCSYPSQVGLDVIEW